MPASQVRFAISPHSSERSAQAKPDIGTKKIPFRKPTRWQDQCSDGVSR